MDYEYRVVPAPKQLKRVKGASTEELCAATLTDAINAEARQGWEYLRSETLSAETPRGLFRRGNLVEETVLVFRRARSTIPIRPVVAAPEPAIHTEPPREAERPAAEARDDVRREERGLRPQPQRESPRPVLSRPVADGESPTLLRPVPRHKPGGPV